jgi:phage gpG-like protein
MINVLVRGLPQFEAIIAKLNIALDSTEILDEAGALLLNRIRTRFLAETDPDGVPWKPSKAAMKRRSGGYKRKGIFYSGTGTLFESGRLFRSIQLWGDGDKSRKISTDVPYAGYHNFGIGQEKRTFMGASEEDTLLCERLVVKRIKEALA